MTRTEDSQPPIISITMNIKHLDCQVWKSVLDYITVLRPYFHPGQENPLNNFSIFRRICFSRTLKNTRCSKMHNLQIYIFSRQRSHLIAHTNASHTSSGRIERKKKQRNTSLRLLMERWQAVRHKWRKKAWWRGLIGRDKCWEIKRQWRTRQRELEASF